MDISEEIKVYIDEKIKEAMEEKCRPVSAGTAKEFNYHIQNQYINKNGNLQEQILKLCNLCMVASSEYKMDCFFEFVAHINWVVVQIFRNGWNGDCGLDKRFNIFLDKPLAMQDIVDCQRYIEALMQEG